MIALRKRRSGFTLIEVLMAAAIFAVGSLGVLAMVTTTIDLNRNSRQAKEATILGNWKLEQLEGILGPGSTDFTGCTGGPCWETTTMTTSSTVKTVQLSDLLYGSSSSVAPSVYYQLQWQVGPTSAMASGDLVTVTVYWPRTKNLQVLSDSQAGFVNCSAATSNLCHSVTFYAYRKI